MKSFDIDEYNYRECEVHNHGFYLGEQSKQAEIDELRKRIDGALDLVEKDCIEYGVSDFLEKAISILKGEKNGCNY